jgi:hypothetical protein
MWEDPIRYAAGSRGALSVSDGGEETPVFVYGVLRDIGVTHTANLLRRRQGCEPIVWGVSVVGDRLVSSDVGESDSMESPVVICCVPVSAMTRTRPGAKWS